jgi:hypothetical protein
MPECSICGKEGRIIRGWCALHYQRWQKWGDPLYTERIRGDDEARFWSKVSAPNSNGCREWTGARYPKGYPRWYYTDDTGKRHDIHGGAWILGQLRGAPLEWPAEQALHHCDNPPCCETAPGHLYIGTHRQNMQDMVERGRTTRGRRWRRSPEGLWHEVLDEKMRGGDLGISGCIYVQSGYKGIYRYG